MHGGDRGGGLFPPGISFEAFGGWGFINGKKKNCRPHLWGDFKLYIGSKIIGIKANFKEGVAPPKISAHSGF